MEGRGRVRIMMGEGGRVWIMMGEGGRVRIMMGEKKSGRENREFFMAFSCVT